MCNAVSLIKKDAGSFRRTSYWTLPIGLFDYIIPWAKGISVYSYQCVGCIKYKWRWLYWLELSALWKRKSNSKQSWNPLAHCLNHWDKCLSHWCNVWYLGQPQVINGPWGQSSIYTAFTGIEVRPATIAPTHPPWCTHVIFLCLWGYLACVHELYYQKALKDIFLLSTWHIYYWRVRKVHFIEWISVWWRVRNEVSFWKTFLI